MKSPRALVQPTADALERVVAEMVKAIWPRTFALFEEHDLYGVRLSRTEARKLGLAHV